MQLLLFPILEEIVFRGALQEYLLRKTEKFIGPLSYANLVTSICFALSHIVIYLTFWKFLLFFPSLIFGHFKDKYGTLTVPILLHIYYNVGQFFAFANYHMT